MTVRLAVIGCGAVARRMHLPAFKSIDGVDVVAFASRTRRSCEAAANDWGGGKIYPEGTALALDEIDAVDICSPNTHHRTQAVDAARASKHVLVEKPIACTVAEADEMIAAATKAGVVLHVVQNLRYLPAVVAAHNALAAGEIGRILGLRAAFGHAGPKDWAPDATWFFDKNASGGGALIDLGVHIIDLVRYVTGLEASEVTAMTMTTGQPGAVEDAAHVVVRFEGSALGTIQASWVTRPAPDIGITVFGTDGTLQFDARVPLHIRRATGEKEDIEQPTISASPYSDFVGAIAGSDPVGPAATGSDGRAALSIIEAAYASAASGKTVEVAR